MDACPSSFAWDDHEIHGTPLPDAVARHAGACPRCRRAAERREASRQIFAARIAAPLRRRLAEAPPRPRWTFRGGRWRAASIIGAAALAGLFAVVRLRRTDTGGDVAGYVGAKGDLAIQLAGRRAGRVFLFDGETTAQPGDELELTVRGAAASPYVLVGSVDGTGRFSPFYPASLDARSVQLPPGGRPLQPPVQLDDAPGPERIVVVLSSLPLPAREVARWAESAARRPSEPSAPVPGAPAAVVRWVTLPKGSPR
ncbi:MAG TPA: hypothetical protein VHM31_08920 [Polyangia bacterium]|nr:hypothetical protein [Polyangia bacterium]